MHPHISPAWGQCWLWGHSWPLGTGTSGGRLAKNGNHGGGTATGLYQRRISELLLSLTPSQSVGSTFIASTQPESVWQQSLGNAVRKVLPPAIQSSEEGVGWAGGGSSYSKQENRGRFFSKGDCNNISPPTCSCSVTRPLPHRVEPSPCPSPVGSFMIASTNRVWRTCL